MLLQARNGMRREQAMERRGYSCSTLLAKLSLIDAKRARE